MTDILGFKAVIFDMDGVLLDSEALYKENNKTYFASLGFEVDPDLYNTFIGMSATLIWNTLKDTYALPLTVEEYKLLEKKNRFELLSATDLNPHEHLIELMNLLQLNNIKIAVASMSMKKNILVVLEKLGISPFFSVVMSGEDVHFGKPNPEIFIKTAQLLDVLPEHCIVIEDSKNGVTAAKDAGMACIGFINAGSGNQDLSKADRIIASYSELFVK